MDAELILVRLGTEVRAARKRRGLTQADLARLAGMTRQKVAAIEAGDGTVGALYYGKVLGAMSLELQTVPARWPVLEELAIVFPPGQ